VSLYTRPARPGYILAVALLAIGAWSGFIPGWHSPPPGLLDLVERAIIGTCALGALGAEWQARRRRD
jgi:hypothetical protein